MTLQKLLIEPLTLADAANLVGVSINTLKAYADQFGLYSDQPKGRKKYCPTKCIRMSEWVLDRGRKRLKKNVKNFFG